MSLLVLIIVSHSESIRQLEPVSDIILSLPEHLSVSSQVNGLIASLLDSLVYVDIDLGYLGQVHLEELE